VLLQFLCVFISYVADNGHLPDLILVGFYAAEDVGDEKTHAKNDLEEQQDQANAGGSHACPGASGGASADNKNRAYDPEGNVHDDGSSGQQKTLQRMEPQKLVFLGFSDQEDYRKDNTDTTNWNVTQQPANIVVKR